MRTRTSVLTLSVLCSALISANAFAAETAGGHDSNVASKPNPLNKVRRSTCCTAPSPNFFPGRMTRPSWSPPPRSSGCRPPGRNAGTGRRRTRKYPQKDTAEIQKLFGSGFTDSLTKLTAGQWHGPVLSGYGTHLVYVHHINEPLAPVFAEVQDRVVQDWKFERGEALNEQFYNTLRDSYTVVIEQPAMGEKVTMVQESVQ